MRPELVSITSTQLGRATVLEAGLIGVTTKEEPVVIPVPQPQPEPQPSPQPAPQPAATSSGGGGGAFGLAGLLLPPLAWLRRRR